jgi:glutaredoxin
MQISDTKTFVERKQSCCFFQILLPVKTRSKNLHYDRYCRRAKQLLTNLKVPKKVIELDQHEFGSTIQSYLSSLSGIYTVPQIFVNQKFIGGSDGKNWVFD